MPKIVTHPRYLLSSMSFNAGTICAQRQSLPPAQRQASRLNFLHTLSPQFPSVSALSIEKNAAASGVGASMIHWRVEPLPMPSTQRYYYSGLSGGLFSPSKPRYGLVTFKLADIGEGITEVELLNWCVKEGSQMEIVCEVQSDKSAVEISSRYTGKVLKFHHQPGEMIRIGTPLMDIEVEGDNLENDSDTESPRASAEDSPCTASPKSPQSKSLHSSNSQKSSSSAIAEIQDKEEAASSTETTSSVSESYFNNNVLASPACRRMARLLGVDLSTVKPTGPRNQITKEDVEKAHKRINQSPPQLPSHSTTTQPPSESKQTLKPEVKGGFEVIPLTSGVAKGMVKSMNMSLAIPHMSLQEDIDLTAMLAARQKMNAFVDLQNKIFSKTTKPLKVTITAIVIKAVSSALKSVPILNSKFDILNQDKYTLYHSHNISIANDTPNGLLVPNIKNVETLTLKEIQAELLNLQHLAVTNKLTMQHLTGGTISISNVGVIGGTAVRPILFDGQAAILGLGRVKKVPQYCQETGTFQPRDMMNITASVDHRHVDGATVARFISVLRHTLENIDFILL